MPLLIHYYAGFLQFQHSLSIVRLKQEKWVSLLFCLVSLLGEKYVEYLDANRICGWLCGNLETLIAFFFLSHTRTQTNTNAPFETLIDAQSGVRENEKSVFVLFWVRRMTVKLKTYGGKKIVFDSVFLGLKFQHHYLWIVIIDNKKLLLCTIAFFWVDSDFFFHHHHNRRRWYCWWCNSHHHHHCCLQND